MTENVVNYFPEYYRTMMARLYFFDGAAVTPADSVWVIGVAPAASASGRRRLVSSRKFGTLEDAQRYIEINPAKDLRIASYDPRQSPIPLPALDHYRLEHHSAHADGTAPERPKASVKVFSVQP